MSFSSSWDEISGDREGIDIDATAGTHSPDWESMDDETQEIIVLCTRAAEGIVAELALNLTDEEHRFRVNVSGHVSDENKDSASSYVNMSVIQTDGPGGTPSGT